MPGSADVWNVWLAGSGSPRVIHAHRFITGEHWVTFRNSDNEEVAAFPTGQVRAISRTDVNAVNE